MQRFLMDLASLEGPLGGASFAEELERLKKLPLQRLPPLPLIFQHCLLPQITAKVCLGTPPLPRFAFRIQSFTDTVCCTALRGGGTFCGSTSSGWSQGAVLGVSPSH